jgi:hypothetical protein
MTLSVKDRGFSLLLSMPRERKADDREGALRAVGAQIESGLLNTWLGGSLLKKRVAKANRAKSAGFTTIAAYRQHDRLVFLHVFGKNERDYCERR